MQSILIVKLLILLTLANGAPVVAKKILGARFARPLDGGLMLADGRPLFGASKTIRGVVLAILAATAGAPLLGFSWRVGFVAGIAAMIGDLLSSFLKRRLNLPPSSRATGIDQIPESLFPFLACAGMLSLTAVDIAVGVAIFFIGELLVSRVLYKFRLRDRPY